jgi:hypothetical protein
MKGEQIQNRGINFKILLVQTASFGGRLTAKHFWKECGENLFSKVFPTKN